MVRAPGFKNVVYWAATKRHNWIALAVLVGYVIVAKIAV
jgi:hypothetical protein